MLNDVCRNNFASTGHIMLARGGDYVLGWATGSVEEIIVLIWEREVSGLFGSSIGDFI